MSNLKTKEKTAPGAKPEAAKGIDSAPSVSPAAAAINLETLFENNPWTDMGDGTRRFTTDYGKTFSTGPGGVFIIENRDGKEVEKSICGPLWVSGDIENEEGEDQRRAVKWRDCVGREHEHVFRREEFATDPKGVLRVLLSGGLHLGHAVNAQGSSAPIQNYLLNYPVTKKIKSVDRLGWWDLGKCFALPGGVVIGEPPEPMIFTGDWVNAPHYSQKGSLEDWKKSVGADALYSRRVMFSLCVGLTPPLMSFCQSENGGFHFYGKTSKGKSTMARALCSLWAPAVEGGEMGSWKKSENGPEAVANAHDQFPVILDEISHAKPQLVEETVYLLGNGRGKDRMSRDLKQAETLSWKTMFLSTGEHTTEEWAARASYQPMQDGALIRMVNIPATVSNAFGVFNELPDGVTADALIDRINLSAQAEAYGTAGPAFIRGVIEEVANLGGVEAFRERLEHDRAEWVRKHCDSKDSKILRVAKRFGLVAAAGELAIIRGVFPWAPGDANKAAAECFNAWLGVFETDDLKEEALISAVTDFIVSNQDYFDRVGFVSSVHVAGRERYGYLLEKVDPDTGEVDSDTVDAYIITSVFSNRFCKPRLTNMKKVSKVLLEHGRLKTNDEQRGTYRKGKGLTVHEKVPLEKALVVLNVHCPARPASL